MKQIISNLFVAVVSSAFTFLFFVNYYQSDPEEIYEGERTMARLARLESTGLLNTKPQNRPVYLPENFVAVSKTVTDAIVNITALNSEGRPVSNGSGVIYSSNGYIITNHHVVEEGYRFEITLSDKRRLSARVIGTDPATDIALIKIETRDLNPLYFGNSDVVEVGEWVLAIGNPFNLTSTVTAGIVSAKGRNLNIIDDTYSIESFIQTDAVVNPGNSGGALINTRGELIGINTAILSESGGYEGYSFAIPGNLVKKVVEDLQIYGFVQRAILGVKIREINDKIASDLNLPAIEGILVSDVNPGSSAAKAGLSPWDVIIGINNVRVSTVPQLQELIARFRPGDRISLDFYRKGRRLRIENVELQALNGTGFSSRGW